ncbi:MAG: hypothetical protein WCR97_03550 [Bacilli bacterium]
MNKKYVIFQIKKWLPLFGILFIFLALVYWMSFSSMSIYQYFSYDDEGALIYFDSSSSGISNLSFPILICAIVVPFFVLEYKSSSNKCDTYFQLPFKKNELKITRGIVSLLGLLICFTVAYWIAILILYLRVINAKPLENANVQSYRFIGYLFLYFILLVETICTFGIVSFFVSLGNSIFSSILLVLFGELLLSFVFNGSNAFYCLITNNLNNVYGSYSLNSIVLCPNFNSNLLNEYIKSISEFEIKNNFYIYGISIYTVLGICSYIYLCLVNDPSGEFASKSGGRNKFISLIIHTGIIFFTTYLLVTSYSYSILTIIYLLMFEFFYYLALLIFNKTPKLNKYDWIYFGCGSGINLIITFLVIFIRFNG